MNRRIRLTGVLAVLAAALLIATSPAMAAAPKGQFPLKGTLKNTAGTALKLTALGATSFESVTGPNGQTRTALRVDEGEGLELSKIPTAARGSYTIEVVLQYDDVAGYQRILSFGPADRDAGLYVYNGGIALYPVKDRVADTPFEAGDWVTVRVARNGATGRMQVYWSSPDMIWLFTYKDTAGKYKLRSGIVDLVRDDAGEDGAGYLARVTFWSFYNPKELGID